MNVVRVEHRSINKSIGYLIYNILIHNSQIYMYIYVAIRCQSTLVLK